MEDFYKQIKENLKKRPEPKFRERDWKALSHKMGKKRVIPLWYIMPLGLLLLGGGNVYWFLQARSNHSAESIVKQTDTIYVVETHIKTDTVYVNNVVQNKKSIKDDSQTSNIIWSLKNQIAVLQMQLKETNNLLFNENRHINKEPKFNEPTTHRPSENNLVSSEHLGDHPIKGEMPLDQHNVPVVDSILKDNPDTISVTGKIKKPWEKYALVYSDLNAIETPYVKTSTLNKEKESEKPLKGFRLLLEEIKEFKVREFQIGSFGGFYYPSFGAGEYTVGKSLGVQVVAPLSPHFQLESNLGYHSVIYETMTFDELSNPDIILPDANLTLDKVEAPFKFLQWDLGLNYVFNVQNHLQPKIGVGYGLQYYWQKEVNYEYIGDNNGLNWNFEETINKTGFDANSLILKMGTDYYFDEALILILNGSYRSILGGNSYLVPNYWSVSGGLRIKF